MVSLERSILFCSRAIALPALVRTIWQLRLSTNADVAQLVEHFTRNEGVPGSSPGVGFGTKLLLVGCSLEG